MANVVAEYLKDAAGNLAKFVPPVATADRFGGIKAEEKTDAETNEVKIDSTTGKLYAAGGGTGGAGIDDDNISTETTFSSSKINNDYVTKINPVMSGGVKINPFNSDGEDSVTVADTSVSFGDRSNVLAPNSINFGDRNEISESKNSHIYVFGVQNTFFTDPDGAYSGDTVIEGSNNVVNSSSSHIEGTFNTIGIGGCNHIEGSSNTVGTGDTYLHIEGTGHTVGTGNTLIHLEGKLHTVLDGNKGLHIEGLGTQVGYSNEYITAVGDGHNLGNSNSCMFIQGRTNTIGNGNNLVHIDGYDNSLGYDGENIYITGQANQVSIESGPADKVFIEGDFNKYALNYPNVAKHNHMFGYGNTTYGGGMLSGLISGDYNYVFAANGQSEYLEALHVLGNSNNTQLSKISIGNTIMGRDHILDNKNSTTHGATLMGYSNRMQRNYEGNNGQTNIYGIYMLGYSNQMTPSNSDSSSCNIAGSGIIGCYNTLNTYSSVYATSLSGYSNTANIKEAYGTHIDGYGNSVSLLDGRGYGIHVEGHYNTLVSSRYINNLHLDGYHNTVYATADGVGINGSSIKGYYNEIDFVQNVNFSGSSIEGYQNTVNGIDTGSYIGGKLNDVFTSADASFIAGNANKVNVVKGLDSLHVEGYMNTITIAPNADGSNGAFIIGRNNKCEDAKYNHFMCGQGGIVPAGSKDILVVGGGDAASPKNIFTVDADGEVYVEGNITERGDSTKFVEVAGTEPVNTLYTTREIKTGNIFDVDVFESNSQHTVFTPVYSAKCVVSGSSFTPICTYFADIDNVTVEIRSANIVLTKSTEDTKIYCIKLTVR